MAPSLCNGPKAAHDLPALTSLASAPTTLPVTAPAPAPASLTAPIPQHAGGMQAPIPQRADLPGRHGP